ncbi:MAG: methyltransferase domain-containing protein [Myxococcales bacterium]
MATGTTISSAGTAPQNNAPDLAAIKARQQAMWASGDFSVVGTTLQLVGEQLCESMDLCPGERVLDVACGNGHAALAAARRYTEVTGLDYVPSLLERARERAQAERAQITFVEGDAEAMPFPDQSFDAVISTYGVMFAPDQERAARELTRVCRPGGKIGLASWTPEGMIGGLLKIVGRYVPPPAGLRPTVQWGTESRLQELFAGRARIIHAERKPCVFRYLSPEHCVDVFRRYYGPTYKAFQALAPAQQQQLERDMIELFTAHNRSGGKAMIAPAEYLEVVLQVG